MSITIAELMLFPVKSLGGYSLEKAQLTDTGLAFDRHWMIINERSQFVTQRQSQYKNFALISTHLTNTHLTLSTPSMSDFILDLAPPKSEVFEATVWKDTVKVVDEGLDASNWLTEAANSKTPLRLVRKAEGMIRPQSKPELLGASTHTHFADSAPLLVTNLASLDTLNEESRLESLPLVTMKHFRPNIVIAGIPAYDEHIIECLNHELYQLKFCYPCQRCVVITIDPDTGDRYAKQHPFKQLARQNSMPNQPKAPAFGENAIVTRGLDQTIALGDCLKATYKVH